ncbi:hypothetical protein [Streptosporangium roseum]|uniref:hypothetical protein n=1 Tax=Streptosporangium roseum TaxID=2001 RepID=UPI003317C5C3
MYGSPAWLRDEEYPPGGPWSFLFQLDACSEWCPLDLGEGGVGYGFISGDEQEGRFLWQCI